MMIFFYFIFYKLLVDYDLLSNQYILVHIFKIIYIEVGFKNKLYMGNMKMQHKLRIATCYSELK